MSSPPPSILEPTSCRGQNQNQNQNLELELEIGHLKQNFCSSCRSFSSVCKEEVLENRGEAAYLTKELLEALHAPPTDQARPRPHEPSAVEGGDSAHRPLH